MTVPTFRDMTLIDAEAELVGAVIDHEHALLTALRLMPLDDFRSEHADELRRVFYVCAGWYDKGIWDRETNRERLALYFDDFWVDGLWCPWGAVPTYVEALCNAITASNGLLDDAVAATRRWRTENTLLPGGSRSASPPPVSASAARKGGFFGGIQI